MDEPHAVEALRASSGLSLVVFPADRTRAWLPADRRLEDLAAADLAEVREGAVPLTETERLLRRDGELWYAQQTGPAWADPDEASGDLCGLLFTRLDASGSRHHLEGRPPGPPPPDAELLRILEAAIERKAAAEREAVAGTEAGEGGEGKAPAPE